MESATLVSSARASLAPPLAPATEGVFTPPPPPPDSLTASECFAKRAEKAWQVHKTNVGERDGWGVCVTCGTKDWVGERKQQEKNSFKTCGGNGVRHLGKRGSVGEFKRTTKKEN